MSVNSPDESSFDSYEYSDEMGEGEDNPNLRGGVPAVERFLPIANTVRIMRKTLPANAKISQSSKELVTECASEFISFITSE